MVAAFKSGKGLMDSLGRFFKAFAVDVEGSATSLDKVRAAANKVTTNRGAKKGPFAKDKSDSEFGNFDLSGNLNSLKSLKGGSTVGTRGTTNTNNAKVTVDVRAPAGTKIKSEADNPRLFNLDSGITGAP